MRLLYIEYLADHAALLLLTSRRMSADDASTSESLVNWDKVFAPSTAPRSEGGSRRIVAPPRFDLDLGRHRLLRSASFLGAVTALTAMMWFGLGTLVMSWRPDGAPAAAPAVAARPQFVARLVRTTGAKWLDESTAPVGGAYLRRDQVLDLREGTAEVEFKTGARVLLEGPAQFALGIDPASHDKIAEVADQQQRLAWLNGGVLLRGQLTARVPERARGFQVETPLGSVTDLGTEFSLVVAHENQIEVHVFEGAVVVAADPPTDQGAIRLPADRALRVARDPISRKFAFHDIAPQPQRFAKNFTPRAAPQRTPGGAARQQPVAAGLWLYLRFEEMPHGPQTALLNWASGSLIAPRHCPPTVADVFAPRVPGARLENRGSLHLSGSHALAVPDAPNLGIGDMTVELWLKADRADAKPQNQFVVAKYPGSKAGGWAITALTSEPSRSAGFDVRSSDGTMRAYVAGTKTILDGRWHHVAGVVDRKAAKARLYLDGQLQGEAPLPFNYEPLRNDAPLQVGRREAGNHFRGMVDEVRIHAAALEPSQFLYEPSMTNQ